jgi:hypothetical protein
MNSCSFLFITQYFIIPIDLLHDSWSTKFRVNITRKIYPMNGKTSQNAGILVPCFLCCTSIAWDSVHLPVEGFTYLGGVQSLVSRKRMGRIMMQMLMLIVVVVVVVMMMRMRMMRMGFQGDPLLDITRDEARLRSGVLTVMIPGGWRGSFSISEGRRSISGISSSRSSISVMGFPGFRCDSSFLGRHGLPSRKQQQEQQQQQQQQAALR